MVTRSSLSLSLRTTTTTGDSFRDVQRQSSTGEAFGGFPGGMLHVQLHELGPRSQDIVTTLALKAQNCISWRDGRTNKL